MKKPLIGSASVSPSRRWLRRVATALIDWREDSQSPTAPPSTKREPTTISMGSSRSTPSMPGNSASSCCRSASMTARNGAPLASMPSTQALDRPRRPTRRRQRTRGNRRESAWSRSAVPSGESSSTKMTSKATPCSTRSSRLSSSSTLSISLKVGITTASSIGIESAADLAEAASLAISPAVDAGCESFMVRTRCRPSPHRPHASGAAPPAAIRPDQSHGRHRAERSLQSLSGAHPAPSKPRRNQWQGRKETAG